MLWELDRILANYPLPQKNLLWKTRRGTNAAKVHDKPATLHRLAITDPETGKTPTFRMKVAFNENRVMALSLQVPAPTARLETSPPVKGGIAPDHLSEARS